MGIYYGNEIYGVRIINRQNTAHILYEAMYKQPMTEAELKVFFATYEDYANKKTYVPMIAIYIGFTTTYDNPPSNGWTWEMKHSLQDLKDMCPFSKST